MHNIAAVHVVDASQNLIHKVLVMRRFEFLLAINQMVEVRLHELSYNIHVVVSLWALGPLNIEQLNNVFVFEEL